ncbi:MFS general substrate transporter [Pleomassaria siparia CBS 279.74]|uniref:MFS general substrate transporter n=1 Tax=Pleomassaria siparia CBS 279.74 TaxID=1314801 RepID=A0A6G1JU13_9PLEO|nr:MFS general substrate transporter [Pleomassaria siparia CBS 279.74]
MFLCYFLQFLDKVVINYANILGLQKDLGMKGQNFQWVATAFFIGYAVAEFPQGLLLQKFPPSKVLGFNVFCWGITLCCTSAVHNFAGLAAIRTLLGCFEAVITPSLILITTSWYTKKQSTPRYGIWYCGLGVGQFIGGLISFAAQNGPKNVTFAGWRIMMISVGVFNLIVATLVIFYLPDSVATAKFLTPNEKTFIASTLATDQSGNGKRVFKIAGLWEALRDLQIWLLFVNTILIGIPSGVITTFSATLIAGFGYNSKQGALLNMPSGIISIFATIICTFTVKRGIPRWMGIIALMVPTMLGAGLMSFLPKSNRGGVLAGIYLINFDVAPLVLVYALIGSNTQGYTKKVVATTMIAIAFSVANIIGPQTFRTTEAPGYISAKITIFGVNGGCIAITTLLRLLYGYRNAKNAKNAGVVEGLGGIDDEDLTDMTNPTFKYVY